ncbi:hypothetical protein [Methylomarinum vadi]|uniref:hypothetical protein n=1 Tax=Methylomarinum vadi TaxID=438855 RepID=UPI0004DF2B17|nr:hypothetical protein [Methylomarinum vadi]
MSKSIFKKSALATAVTTVMFAGAANAADITGPNAFPKSNGEVFLGANNTKVRIVATESIPATEIKATIHYYDDSDTLVGSSLAQTDSDAGAGVVINLTTSNPDGATKAIITLDSTSATDTVAGGLDTGFVNPDGSFTGSADPVNDAIAANAFLAIDSTYNTISVVDAKVDTVASPKVLYVTFSADPNIARSNPLAADEKITVKEGLTSVGIISSSNGGITGTLATNVHAFVKDDGKNAAGTDLASLNPYAAAIASVSNSTGLDDGAGNVPVAPATIAPITALAAPEYAGTGEVMVAVSGAPDDLYGDNGVGSVTLAIRLNDVPDSTTWDEAEDIAFNVAGVTVIPPSFNVTADADGDDTILTVDVAAGGLNKFYADPATGDLLHGDSRADAVPFSARVKQATANGGASDLALGLNNAVVIDADLDLTPVKVGEVQAPMAVTQDSDLNGYIDGIKIDFMQPLNGVGSGANLGLISYLNDSDLQGSEVARPVNLATQTPTVSTDSTEVTLLLQNPDVPAEDGTAPDAASVHNDYNADGTVDQDDADLVIDDNLDTAATGVQPGDIPGAVGDLPFSAEIGINTAAAEEDNSDVETDLVYKFAYDAQTGARLAVDTTRFAAIDDGASPVVKRVEYIQTDDGKVSGRDPSGTVTVVASEDLSGVLPNVGEFLFNNKPVSLINLDANLEDKAVAKSPLGNEFDIENVPGTVFGQLLTLGVTPNVFDLNDNALVLSDNDDQNAVQAPAAAAPRMVSAEPVHAAESLKWNKVIVTYDQDIEKADADTDLGGLFVVRARVGTARGDAFQNRDDGTSGSVDGNTVSDDAYYDFRIPAAGVAISGSQVTLTLPIDDFPADTQEIWVDYEGATDAEIEAGSTHYLKSAETETPADVEAGDNAGESLFYGEFDTNGSFPGGVADDDIPETVDVAAYVDPYDGINIDNDTVKANLPPLFLATNGTDNHRNIFVQTIKGTAKRGSEDLIDGTGVRVDLVRVEEGSVYTDYAERGAVGDGYIEVRRGANSDGNTNTPTGNEYQSGAPDDQNDDTGADEWQTIALKNDLVKVQTLDDIVRRNVSITKLQDNIDKLQSENASADAIAKVEKQLYAEMDAFEVLYVDHHDPQISGYVKVTTGDGRTSGDGNVDVNSNANVGRTATLVSRLDNKQENGTTYYPVTVHLTSGDITERGRDSGQESVQHGSIDVKMPQAESTYKSGDHYKVLDTAWAIVENGQYKAVVGMEQAATNAKTTQLQQQYNDAFILVSVRDPNKGTWVLTNSAEPSFASYKPFGADIESDLSNPNRNIHNIDLDMIAGVQLYGDGMWETFGWAGEAARDDSKPLDLHRFFITVDEDDGRPVTVWHLDHGDNEMLFALGLGEKPNNVQLQFELGGGGDSDVKTIGKVQPAPGAAFAYLGDGEALEEDCSEVHNNGTGYSSCGVLDDGTSDHKKLFIPLASKTAAVDLGTSGWHLVSMQQAQSIKDYAAAHAGVDGVIAFVNQANATGNVDSSKNYTYFPGDEANDAEINEVLPAGQALFVHIQGDN